MFPKIVKWDHLSFLTVEMILAAKIPALKFIPAIQPKMENNNETNTHDRNITNALLSLGRSLPGYATEYFRTTSAKWRSERSALF